MKLHSLFLSSMLRWNISPEDPATWPAFSALGAVVLNPFVAMEGEPLPTSFPLSDDKYHVLTNRLYVATPELMPAAALDEVLKPWLRALRIASKQASLPIEVYGFSQRDIDLATIRLALPVARLRGTLFGEFHIRTALDDAAIRRAHELRTDAAAPLYHELLLDALQACEARRHREAILYSAIAVESLAQYELTTAYDATLVATPPPPHMNILNFALANGQAAKKDPIFSLLIESDNFGRLLHEAPLYLMRRSLLNEVPDLFRKAKSLYSTRNRLSHGQAVEPGDESRLQIDSEGATAAVQIAVDVFAWFGQTGYYIPDHRVVQIEA